MNTFYAKAIEKIRPHVGEKNTPSPNVSVALYVAAAIAQITGLVAVGAQLGQASFTYFTIITTLVGMTTSYYLRRLGTPPRLIKIGALFLAVVFLYALGGAGFFGALVPPESHGTQEMSLVSALAFTATFCSFLLLSDDAVVFTCVWAIAIIGLTGTVDINTELIFCFIVFLAAAAFLLVHQNALAHSAPALAKTSSSSRPTPRFSWVLLRTQAAMAMVSWAVSLFLGALIAIPVQMVGRNMSLGTIIQRLRVPPTPSLRISGAPRLVFDNPSQFNVGLGPVDDDPIERLTVYSEKPHYWRGRTYDQYTKSGWTSSYEVRPFSGPAPDATTPSSTAPDGESIFNLPHRYGKLQKVEQAQALFRVSSGLYSPLYHAAEPVQVKASLARLYIRPDNTVRTGRGAASDYSVVSEVSVAKASDLRQSPMRYEDDDISFRYRSTEPFNDNLQTLVDEALQNVPNDPYSRAMALKRFVGARCVYTREARAVPKGADAAEFFLNESREGYCDLYATALAVLCRYAGLPSRVATGFAPGTPTTPEPDAIPAGVNKSKDWQKFVLRGSDLHAWTEVYFANYGWIAFDATDNTSSVSTPVKTPEPAKQEKSFWSFWEDRKAPILLVLLGVIGVLYVAASELASRFRNQRQVRVKVSRHADDITRLYFGATQRIGKHTRLYRSPSSTANEYVEQVRSSVGNPLADTLASLTVLLQRASYGPETISEADVKATQEAVKAVKTALRATPRPPKKGKQDAASA